VVDAEGRPVGDGEVGELIIGGVGLARYLDPEKDAAKKDVELLIKQADAVKSRASDGRPATGEMRLLVDQVARLQTFVGAHPLPSMANWQAVQTSLGKLQEAFGLTP